MPGPGYVVIGGGIAATQAAETIRARSSEAAITLIAEEPRPFYLRPLLADFVAGRVSERDLWRDFESVAAAKNITLMTGCQVVGIDRAARTVSLSEGGEVGYDGLVVATGVKPVLPGIPGVDLDRVATFSTYDDAARVAEWVGDATRAVVVGRGLQGVELARALRLSGLEVTMIVPDESPWFPALFRVQGSLVEEALRDHGVEVLALDQAVALVGEGGRVRAVKTRKGREVPAEIVGFALDQRAQTGFLVGSGISLADGVVVDRRLQSTDPSVYAAGDVAQIRENGRLRTIGYGWMRARAQGEAAARNLTGGSVEVAVGDESEAQALYGASILSRWQ